MFVAIIIIRVALATDCSFNCTDTYLKNSLCNLNCMTISCNFDNGECASECATKNCFKNKADNVCDEECNNEECGYDWGDCLNCTEKCALELFKKFQCYASNDIDCPYKKYLCDGCLERCRDSTLYSGIFIDECCTSGFYNNEEYKNECNNMYYTSYIESDNKTSFIESNPVISLYVSDEAWGISKNIFLIGHGIFNLNVYDDNDNDDEDGCEKFYISNQPAQIIIKPLYCDKENTAGCYKVDEKVTIMVSDLACMKIYNNTFTMENIIFSQNKSSKFPCGTCNYCIGIDIDLIHDDQGNNLTSLTYLNSSECKIFQDKSFIELFKGSSLYLKNVNFENMRLGFAHLIKSSYSNFYLENSNFSNIFTSEETIYMESDESGNINAFEYKNSLVSLINNGYEPTNNYKKLKTFIYLYSMDSAIIRNVIFKNNLANDVNSFISIINACQIELSSLEFIDNYAFYNLIYFTICPYNFYQPSLYIDKCTFERNYAKSIINGEIPNNCQELEIENNKFVDNIAKDSALKMIRRQDFSVDCDEEQIKWDFLFNNNNFTSNYATINILNIGDLKLISFTYNRIELSYEYNSSIIAKKMPNFTNSDIIYMKKGFPSLESNTSQALLYFGTLDTIDILHSNFEYNNCSLIYVTKAIKELYLKYNKFSHNFQRSNEWLLDLTLEYAEIHNLVFFNNTITSKSQGLMSLKGISKFSNISVFEIKIIQSIIFIDFESIPKINIDDLTVSECISNDYLGISLTISSNSVFNISNSNFESGKSNLFTFKSKSNGSSLSLFVDSITISNYESEALISIDSSIENCEFCEIMGVNVIDSEAKFLTFTNIKGDLYIKSSSFTNINITNNFLIEVIDNSNLIIENCLFKEIISNSIVYPYNAIATIKNSEFSRNNGIAIKVSFGKAEIQNSLIHDNQAEYGSVAYITENSEIIFENCIIKNNTVSQNGVIFMMDFSTAEAKKTLFTENKATGKGGVIFIDQGSTINIESSEFSNNTAFRGSCIFAQHSQGKSTIHNTDFFENSAVSAGCLSLLESNFIITNSNFYDNKADYYPALEIFYYSNATLVSCYFANHEGVGAHIGVEEKSLVTIKHTQFLSSSSEYCCSVFNVLNSEFNCDYCEITDSISLSTSPIYFEKSNSTFTNSKITNVYTGDISAVIKLDTRSSITFNDSVIMNYNGSAIYLSISTSGIISRSKFENGSGIQGTGIQCLKCTKVIIEDSNFKNLLSNKDGGCLYLNLYDDEETVIIKNSTFSFCNASFGGGVYAKDTNINIYNCYFDENNAESIYDDGKGGALYLEYPSQVGDAEVVDSSFNNNFARTSGGAIQWYNCMPAISHCTFLNNSASYGPDTASFSYKLKVLESNDLYEEEFPPGQLISLPILIKIQDHYNQTVLTDFSSVGDLLAISPQNYTISGNTKVTASSGILVFSEIKIFGPPDSLASLEASSFFYELSNTSKASLKIKLRNCNIGEYLLGEDSCETCAKGTYNLKAGDACKKCPNEGICYGGAEIVASSGYWRHSKNTDIFFECPYPEACLEEKLNSSKATNCLEGYTSNLCQSCAQGYSRSGENLCSQCLDNSKIILVLIGWLIFNIIIIGGITASSINDAFKEESVVSIYFKIFMNYLQLVTLTISIDLNWPSMVEQMFYYQSRVSGSINQIVTIDCFLSGNMQPYYAKLMFLDLAPVVCAFFSVIFWMIWGKIRASKNLKEKIFGSLVVQLFIFHPNLLKYNFSIFNCMKISPGEYYLFSDLGIKCWEEEHLSYTLGVAIPSIIVFCIVLPMFLLIMMFKKRDQLECATEKLKYGFLYKGFKPNRFYWEFCIMLRKIIIICTSVFLKNSSTSIQALIIFLVILLAYSFQRKLEPYNANQLNEMELKSILVSAVTIYAGLFFLTKYIDLSGKIILFCFMIMMNMLFLLYWVYYTFGYYIGKIYLRFNFCKKCFRGTSTKWIAKVVPEVELANNTSVVPEDKEPNIFARTNSFESNYEGKKKAKSCFYPENDFEN